MNSTLFIAGDWGTTNLRVFLLEKPESGPVQVVERRTGRGVGQGNDDYETVLTALIADWTEQYGRIPIVLSGMIGSSIGWVETPYLSCPATFEQIANSTIEFDAKGHTVSIVTGLSSRNPFDEPDVMRGEELQLLGWSRIATTDDNKTSLVALPGTHNKWVLADNRAVESFVTALSGELFALLRKHSVLIGSDSNSDFDLSAFLDGVTRMQKQRGAYLVHSLFSTRGKQLFGELRDDAATAYLSGLIVGADIVGATALFERQLADGADIALIGDSVLANYYRVAGDALGFTMTCHESDSIAVAGFDAVVSARLLDVAV